MKKILFACFIMLAGWGSLQAQTRPAQEKKAAVEAPKKADGTLDMRYKVNKEKKKASGPLKKDGTPDKRYKANKEGTKK
jgi:hypothetical protein